MVPARAPACRRSLRPDGAHTYCCSLPVRDLPDHGWVHEQPCGYRFCRARGRVGRRPLASRRSAVANPEPEDHRSGIDAALAGLIAVASAGARA